MFGRGWGPFAPGRGRGRVFERGDLKYVILELLAERPRHGYDVIRALEERFRGLYAPSPGAVYPTLQMLEEMGYATANVQDGKRTYAITEDGRRFLAEQGQATEEIRARIGEWWGPEVRAEAREMMGELHDLGRLFRHQWRSLDRERMRRIREVVVRARGEIEAILADERRPASPTAL
jgi:DNA-binding PadR family transcriptional regulator